MFGVRASLQQSGTHENELKWSELRSSPDHRGPREEGSGLGVSDETPKEEFSFSPRPPVRLQSQEKEIHSHAHQTLAAEPARFSLWLAWVHRRCGSSNSGMCVAPQSTQTLNTRDYPLSKIAEKSSTISRCALLGLLVV